MTQLRRRFFDLADRQIHYRTREGDGAPLIALHALPGSARQLEPLLRALEGRRVIAPDLAGFGDSDPSPEPRPSIADHARDVLALADGLGLETVDLYGTHTGAAVALEAAIAAPQRVRRLVLDGVPLFDAETVRALADRYAPKVEPDHNGGHLLWAHNFCRDMLLFWPWFDKSAGAVRNLGLPEPRALSAWVLEVIKGLDALPGGYAAAFAYDAAARLPQVRQPTLCVVAAADTLDEASRRAAELLPAGRLVEVEGAVQGMAPPDRVAAAAARFLDQA
jgi:pimeloyl-ACP methyl ester carboxylesterase